MTFTVLIYAWRKPGTTPAQFKEHYEGSHMTLVKSVAGKLFPLSHVRRYTALKEDGSGPNVMMGNPTSMDYDSVAELTFESVEAFQKFFGTVSQPETAAKLAADEELFLDRPRMKVCVVSEINTTTRD